MSRLFQAIMASSLIFMFIVLDMPSSLKWSHVEAFATHE
jgi:hypothetical protein